MEVIIIDSQAFKVLMEKLDISSDYVSSLKPPVADECDAWVDSHEICGFFED